MLTDWAAPIARRTIRAKLSRRYRARFACYRNQVWHQLDSLLNWKKATRPRGMVSALDIRPAMLQICIKRGTGAYPRALWRNAL